VAKLAEEWKAKLNLTDPRVNRDSYLKMLDGLVYGEDPRQGFLENRTFYHPELKFEFAVPAAWSFQNTPQQVQMAEKQGKAMMTLTLVEGSSLQEASSSVLKQYVMELVEAEEIIVNGLKAIRMEAGQQQQETIIKTLSYVIEHGGFYYNLMGITHTESFDAFESVFLASMNSFRELKDTEKLNRKPERIRLKTVASDGTLQQVLSGFGVAKDRLEEVSLINGMSLSDPVRKGTLIKVLEQ